MHGVIWLAIAFTVLTMIHLVLVRPWYARWGATDFDVRRAMPGDDLIPRPVASATHALTFAAWPEQIWPWVIEQVLRASAATEQHWFERLLHREKRRGDQAACERQSLQVGDVVSLGPPGLGPALAVQRLAPGDCILLAEDAGASWCAVLYPVSSRSTRMVLRTRIHWRPGPAGLLRLVLAELAAFAIARRILLGVKARAQSALQRRPPAAEARRAAPA